MYLYLLSGIMVIFTQTISNQCCELSTKGMFFSDLCDKIRDQIQACGADSVTILYNERLLDDRILKLFAGNYTGQLLLFNLNNSNNSHIKDKLFHFYKQLRQTFFILLVHRPDDVLQMAEEIFQENRRGAAAIMPHKSQWLVWVWHRSQEEKLTQQQRQRSSMDNVAVVRVKMEFPHSSHNPGVVKCHDFLSFVWGKRRTKQIRCLTEFVKSGGDCELFPNRKYGMNGRHLQVTGKLYMTRDFSDVVYNEHTGKPEYSGFRIELLKVLARTLNFTYTLDFIPQSTREPILNTLERMQWDFAIMLWSTSANYSFLDVTHPVHYERIRGIYTWQSNRLTFDSMSTFLVLPFPKLAIVFLPSSLLVASLVWMVVASVKLEDGFEPNELSQTFSIENGLLHKYSEKFALLKKILHLLSIVEVLSCAIVNQANLPRISRMSSRLIVWSFCAATFIYYATYSGYLTSQMVQRPSDVPFNTFNEMLTKNNFKWGTLRDDMMISEIFNGSTNAMLRQVGQNLILLDDTVDIDTARANMFEKLNEPFVLIYFETLISNILRSGHFVLMKEILVTMNRGFSLPKDSELNDLISKTIVSTHDSGILSHLMKKYRLTPPGQSEDKHRKEDGGKQTVGVEELYFVLFLCACLLAGAVILLSVEMLTQHVSQSTLVKRFLRHLTVDETPSTRDELNCIAKGTSLETDVDE